MPRVEAGSLRLTAWTAARRWPATRTARLTPWLVRRKRGVESIMREEGKRLEKKKKEKVRWIYINSRNPQLVIAMSNCVNPSQKASSSLAASQVSPGVMKYLSHSCFTEREMLLAEGYVYILVCVLCDTYTKKLFIHPEMCPRIVVIHRTKKKTAKSPL